MLWRRRRENETICPCLSDLLISLTGRERENEDQKGAKSAEQYADTPLPQLYTFKLRKPSSGYNICAPPPFYVQLDNLIAVVWALFDANMPLEIFHLHWALAFLSNIRNVQGEYPPDVHFCVQEIQNRLLEKYSEGVKKRHEDKNSTGLPLCEYKLKSSITFKELARNQPTLVQQLYCNENMDLESSTSSAVNCDCCSKGVCVDNLKQLRMDQVVKIEMELLRLYDIEQQIETKDRDCITPFIDDTVANRLKELKKKLDTEPEK